MLWQASSAYTPIQPISRSYFSQGLSLPPTFVVLSGLWVHDSPPLIDPLHKASARSSIFAPCLPRGRLLVAKATCRPPHLLSYAQTLCFLKHFPPSARSELAHVDDGDPPLLVGSFQTPGADVGSRRVREGRGLTTAAAIFDTGGADLSSARDPVVFEGAWPTRRLSGCPTEASRFQKGNCDAAGYIIVRLCSRFLGVFFFALKSLANKNITKPIGVCVCIFKKKTFLLLFSWRLLLIPPPESLWWLLKLESF